MNGTLRCINTLYLNLPEYVYHMDLIGVVQLWGIYYSKPTTSEGRYIY